MNAPTRSNRTVTASSPNHGRKQKGSGVDTVRRIRDGRLASGIAGYLIYYPSILPVLKPALAGKDGTDTMDPDEIDLFQSGFILGIAHVDLTLHLNYSGLSH